MSFDSLENLDPPTGSILDSAPETDSLDSITPGNGFDIATAPTSHPQNYVDLTTNQTIAGIKTFSDSPVVPTPVANTDAANKSYVDSAASSAVSDATFTVGGKVKRTEFNVFDYGAVGDGVTDDTAAIQAAWNAAKAVGGIVRFPTTGMPYMVSARIYQDDRASAVTTLGPTLIGAGGRSGPSPDFEEVGGVQIKCTSSFPLGEYIFDFLGSETLNHCLAGVGIQNMVINCNSRGAGIRFYNCFSMINKDLIIANNPQTPNPSVAGGYSSPSSNTGAVQSNGNPTTNTFYNIWERIFVQGAGMDGFQVGDSGGLDLLTDCLATNCGRFGYKINKKASLIACHAQANAFTSGLHGADYDLGSYDITMTGCITFSGKPFYGNGIKVAGGAASTINITGCTFYGPVNSGSTLTEDDAAVVNIQSSLQNVRFVGCNFLTGTSTSTSDFVYVGSVASGNVTFEACDFQTDFGSALTNVPINLNSTDNILSFVNCVGINPIKTKSWGIVTNAQQTIQLGVTGGVPNGGTFTLTFGGQTTSALAYNASASTIQTALRALSSINGANVNCSGGNVVSHPVYVDFVGTLANASQAAITGDGTNLTGAATPTVTVNILKTGGANVTFDRKIGHHHNSTLSGDISPTLTSGLVIGDILILELTQDSSGSHLITWPSNAKLMGSALSLSTSANSVDLIKFIWDGTNWQEISRKLQDVSYLTTSKGYTLQASAASTSPADGVTTYFGSRFSSALGSVNFQKIYIPKAGTVKAIYLFFANTGTLGSNETSTASFWLNNTSATTISSAITNDAAQTAFNNTGLSIAVAAGDFFEIRMLWATWSTNPTNVFASAVIYIE